MSPKQELSQVRKDQILEAAATVFARLGFHKARMDDIVQEAGLSKGAVYWYFESKDEIFTTILDRFMERYHEDFQRISQGEGPIPDQFRTMMKTLAQEIDMLSNFMPIIYEYYAVAAREEAIRRTIDQYLTSYTDLLEELIKQGAERGELKEVPARDVALALVALMEGCMLIWILRSDGEQQVDLEKLFMTSIDLVLKGLQAGT